MRFPIFMAVLAAQAALISLGAQSAPGPKLELPGYAASPAAGSNGPAANPTAFSLAEAWLAENAPQCPPALASEIAAKFVEQLSLRYPGDADRLNRSEISLRQFDSLLWQMTAARLSGPAYETARQVFAGRRARSVLAVQGGEVDPKTVEAAVNRLKSDSPAAYRRLAEGRMEDEELLRIPGLNPARETVRKEPAAPAKPKELTAAEIVGEFARRHQVGAAAAKLRAYQMEARLRNKDGVEQEILLYRLRPDRFRAQLRTAGKNETIVAFDGTRFWRQVPGRAEIIPNQAAGSLRRLGEFLDLLFEPGSATFTRIEDGVIDGRKCYRLAVTRPDGPGYIAELDQENFHEVSRQETDGTRTRYSDFREVAGFTIPFREEVTSPDGGTGSLVISKLRPNPGLIESFFAPPLPQQLDLFSLEQLLAATEPAPKP